MLATILAATSIAQPQVKPPSQFFDKHSNVTVWSTGHKEFRKASSFGFEFRVEFPGKELKTRPLEVLGAFTAFRKAGSEKLSDSDLAQWADEKTLMLRWEESPKKFDIDYLVDKKQDRKISFFTGRHLLEQAWINLPIKDFEGLANAKEAFVVVGQDRFTLNEGHLKFLQALLQSFPKDGEPLPKSKNSPQ
jgi:hypothetical protein